MRGFFIARDSVFEDKLNTLFGRIMETSIVWKNEIWLTSDHAKKMRYNAKDEEMALVTFGDFFQVLILYLTICAYLCLVLLLEMLYFKRDKIRAFLRLHLD